MAINYPILSNAHVYPPVFRCLYISLLVYFCFNLAALTAWYIQPTLCRPAHSLSSALLPQPPLDKELAPSKIVLTTVYCRTFGCFSSVKFVELKFALKQVFVRL